MRGLPRVRRRRQEQLARLARLEQPETAPRARARRRRREQGHRHRPRLPHRHRRVHPRPQGPELAQARPGREPGGGGRAGRGGGAGGMVVAVAWTFSLPQVYSHTRNLVLIIIAIAIGAVIAVPAARLVKMTAMPQMVAIFNGVGGGAAALVSVTEFISVPGKSLAIYKIGEILFGVLVGSVSLAGSTIAFA